MQVGTIPNQNLETGETASLDVASFFRDPDGGALTYTVASSAPGVVSVSISGSTLTMVGVADGTGTVTVTARDPDGLTAAQGFSVTVETPNRAPEAVGTIPNQAVATGQTATLAVSSYFRDPDGDALTYTAASSAPAVVSVALSGTTLTMVGVADGTGTVTVTARDPDGLTATQGLQVTVTTPNRAPEGVGTIPNQNLEPGRTMTFGVASYFRDPDGDGLTYAAASSAPAVVSVAQSGTSLTMTGVASGSATITVTARDPGGLTAAQSFAATVTSSNRAPEPVGSIPGHTINAGSSSSVDVSSYFRDPDGDALTYAAASSNSSVAGASLSGTTLTMTGVSAGTATVTVTARDPAGLTATQSIGVRVETAGGPDLEFTNVTPTSVTVAPGGTTDIVFTISNSGGATAPPTTIRAFASTDATISTSDREIGQLSTERNIPAGANLRTTITLTVSNQSGTFYFGLCLDPVSGESDTGNNCSPGVHITVGSSDGPDLVVSVAPASATVSPGDSFRYEVTVRNQGDATSPETRLRTFQSTDATISTDDRELGERGTVRSLAPAASAQGEFGITLPSNLTPGIYYFGDCVDAVSGETNVNNNCSSAITVTVETTSSGDTTYTTGQTIETLPTGFWLPDETGGSYQYQFSGGIVTITFGNAGSWIRKDDIRYSCLVSSGCRIVDREVTVGSIRAQEQSSDGAPAEAGLERPILLEVDTEWEFTEPRLGEDPATEHVVWVIIRIEPGAGTGREP